MVLYKNGVKKKKKHNISGQKSAVDERGQRRMVRLVQAGWKSMGTERSTLYKCGDRTKPHNALKLKVDKQQQ